MQTVTGNEIIQPKVRQSAVTSYVIGYIISGLLTGSAYLITANSLLTEQSLVIALLVLAVSQMIVQLLFFLHLGQEARPNWNLMAVISTIGIILMVVVGSMWIMHHLNYNMMPSEMNDHIMEDEAIYK